MKKRGKYNGKLQTYFLFFSFEEQILLGSENSRIYPLFFYFITQISSGLQYQIKYK